MISLLLPAGGTGSRFGSALPKQFLLLGGVPVLRRSLDAFTGLVDEAIIAAPPAWIDAIHALCAGSRIPVRVVPGGATRQDSVHAALTASIGEVILVHDAVRPLVPRACITACLDALAKHDAAVVAIRCAATLKQVATDLTVISTTPRDDMWLAQTPQGFHRMAGLAAFARAAAEGWTCTDDSEILERAGHRVVVVPGDPRNMKITEPADLALAEAILNSTKSP